MTDTSPEIEALYRAMMMQRTGRERVGMGCSMFTVARKIAEAGIRARCGNIVPSEMNKRLLERLYGNDLTPDQLKRALAHL